MRKSLAAIFATAMIAATAPAAAPPGYAELKFTEMTLDQLFAREPAFAKAAISKWNAKDEEYGWGKFQSVAVYDDTAHHRRVLFVLGHVPCGKPPCALAPSGTIYVSDGRQWVSATTFNKGSAYYYWISPMSVSLYACTQFSRATHAYESIAINTVGPMTATQIGKSTPPSLPRCG